MLAAHDQENRLFARGIGGAPGKNQALQPKTPGAKYPKTPVKVSLNDQNGMTRLAGGKSVVAGRGGIENVPRTAGKGKGLTTPLEPRTARAPLGNKTTNAKAQAVQEHQHQQKQKQGLAVKDQVREIEKSQGKQHPASARRRLLAPRVDPAKLSVLSDDKTASKLAGTEQDIERAPAPVPAQKYESDVFPLNGLSFAAFRPENRLRGCYDHYYNPVDADGKSHRDKEMAAKQKRAFEKLDIRVQEDLDSLDWSISDVPASKGFLSRHKPTTAAPVSKAPATVAARSAAAALALGVKTRGPLATALQAKTARPLSTNGRAASAAPASSKASLLSGLALRKEPVVAMPLRPKSSNAPAAEAVSRTTLGYNKGRSALSLVRASENRVPERPKSGGRPPSGASRRGPAATSACNEQAQKSLPSDELADLFGSAGSDEEDEPDVKTPAFAAIFTVDEVDGLNALGESSTPFNEIDDGFQLDVQF